MEHWIPSCCCSCLLSSIRHQVCEGTISRSKCPLETVTSIAKSKTRAHGFVFYFCCHIKEYRLGLKILDAQKVTLFAICVFSGWTQGPCWLAFAGTIRAVIFRVSKFQAMLPNHPETKSWFNVHFSKMVPFGIMWNGLHHRNASPF